MQKIINGLRALFNFLDKYLITPISKLVFRFGSGFKRKTGGVERLLNRPNFIFYASLVFAIIIFVLTDHKMISLVQNEAEVITNVPLTVRYNEEAYVVEGIPTKVDLILTGRKSDIYLAKQLGDHKVILDLTDYDSSLPSYRVNLTYNKSIASLTYKLDPSYVTVTIKDRVSKVVPISYDLLNVKKLDPKLSINKVELTKNEVVVKGSQEALDNIASVKALITFGSKDTKHIIEAGSFGVDNIPVVAYDETGAKVDNILIVPNRLSAQMNIESYSETVPLSVLTTGKLVTGKAIASILVNNSSSFSINIYGDKEKISQIKSVPITIDINGQGNSGTKSYKVSIAKPEGVRYMDMANVTLTVTFGEEKQKTIEINHIKYKNLGDGYSANALKDTTVKVQVKGVQSALDTVNADDISAYIDLAGQTEGDDLEFEVKFENSDPRLTFIALNKMNIKIVKN